MQPSAIRDAVAAAVRQVVLPEGIGKLTATGHVPDAIVAPAFFCGEYSVDYDRAMNRSMDVIELTCRVLVSRADDRSAQVILDGLLAGSGPASLKTAIESARGGPGQPALGGLADDLHVTRMQGYRWYEHAGTQYVGAELAIKIIGKG